jgi:uridine monophosphate synthetase
MISASLRYAERATFCHVPMAKNLLLLLENKQTNLALSADVTSAEQLLQLADLIGPEIAILKTHIDIIRNFTPALISELTSLAQKHQFLLFEDRKFADIGNTVKQQYQGGIYHIAEWADLINAHTLPGPGIIDGLAEIGVPKGRALLLLAEMSSTGHLMDDHYRENTLKMAQKYPHFVIGFIAQHRLAMDPQWLYLTPGVQLEEGYDALGQHYKTPQTAIIEDGSDILIVGRGIIGANNPLAMAGHYREAGWQAYQKRCQE